MIHLKDSQSLATLESLAHALLGQGLSCAVAESCTGGLLGACLSHLPGSSRYFMGGVIAYDNSVKTKILGVSEMVINSKGAVSEEVALLMADGCRNLLGVDIGLAITGIAGPSGGSSQKPVGTVWMALSSTERVIAKTCVFQGDRESVRSQAVEYILGMVVDYLRRKN